MNEPAEIVRAMYEAYGAKDEARLRELIDADVEWNQCPGFPGGARRRGIDDVLAGVLHGNAATWRDFGAPIDEIISAGDRVVAVGRYVGTHAETGRAMEALFTHAYRVADGRIVRFDQVADTWPMVAAARDLDL